MVSCDPIDLVTIENKKKIDVTVKLYFKNYQEAKKLPSFEDFQIQKDSISLVKKLEPNESVLIAGAKGIGKEIENEDYHFEKIDIIIFNDTLMYNKTAFMYHLKKNMFFGQTFEIE